MLASSVHVSMSFVPVHFVPSFHFGSAARAAGVGSGAGAVDVPEGAGAPLDVAGGLPSSPPGSDGDGREGDGVGDALEQAATSAADARTVEERTPSS